MQVCNTELTTGREGRCECRRDMRWNTATGIANFFIVFWDGLTHPLLDLDQAWQMNQLKQQVSVSFTLTWTAAASPTTADLLQPSSMQSKTSRGNSSYQRLLSNKTLEGRSLTGRASPPPSSRSWTARASARPSSPRPFAGTSTRSALSLSARSLHAVWLLQDHKLPG